MSSLCCSKARDSLFSYENIYKMNIVTDFITLLEAVWLGIRVNSTIFSMLS